MTRSRLSVRPLYTGLRVRSLDRSLRFYKALGFRQTLRAKTSIGEFAQLEHLKGPFTIELNRFRRGTSVRERYRKGSEMDHFGFWVSDVDSWVRKLLDVGGKVKVRPYNTGIVIPPRPGFKGRAAYVADPDGIGIELMGPVKRRART
jgi:catechol 2,3-dioxygenase-like lactoylglutathione lyase family enzyme